jgi:SAM-dependent methyltransferase
MEDKMRSVSGDAPVRWPKQPPPLTPAQAAAREGFVQIWQQHLPRRYRSLERFNHGVIAGLPVKRGARTLEIGAGLGEHSRFEDLNRQSYYCLEYREAFCRELVKLFPPDRVVRGDIEQRQSWPDGFFDRVIAVHVLEHLCNLPAALVEIQRLLAPDGCFDVVLPCEGGLAYGLARKISAERLFRREFNLDYTPIARNEHVSTVGEIETELRREFTIERSAFFPLPVPIRFLNLCVAMRLRPRGV